MGVKVKRSQSIAQRCLFGCSTIILEKKLLKNIAKFYFIKIFCFIKESLNESSFKNSSKSKQVIKRILINIVIYHLLWFKAQIMQLCLNAQIVRLIGLIEVSIDHLLSFKTQRALPEVSTYHPKKLNPRTGRRQINFLLTKLTFIVYHYIEDKVKCQLVNNIFEKIKKKF